jgi:hypothetical protein
LGRCFTDGCNDTFEIGQHLLIGKPKHCVSLRPEPRIALGIAPLARFKIMRFAVKLDDQPRRMACEVGDVDSHRDLTTKAQAIDVMRF